ncbi:MAG: hypothetical protein LBV47_06475 [Bacteroidales bacterium]|jgi:hypothetical protein|nr:hypothetical protein [Bacteroidales bacterium]
MRIKEKIAIKLLSRVAGLLQHTPEIPTMSLVKEVGVLWQPEQKEAFQYIHNYFINKNVILNDLCVCNENVVLDATSNTIIPKDLNWLGFPKSGKVDNFTEMHFDILFNIAIKQNVTLDYLTLVSKAKFKVGGQTDLKNYFDLSINIGQNQNALYFVEQQIFYLGQINKKQVNE